MSSTRKAPAADHEYLHSAVVQKRSTENEYDCLVSTDISVHSTRCVLLVKVTAYEAVKQKALSKIASYEFEWPNAGTVGWTASLFNAYVKLDRLVEESLMDAERALAFKQK